MSIAIHSKKIYNVYYVYYVLYSTTYVWMWICLCVYKSIFTIFTEKFLFMILYLKQSIFYLKIVMVTLTIKTFI